VRNGQEFLLEKRKIRVQLCHGDDYDAPWFNAENVQSSVSSLDISSLTKEKLIYLAMCTPKVL
jgi:hypothetical protein